MFLLGAALLIFLLDSLGIRRLELFGGLAVVGISIALLGVLADLQVTPLAGLATVPAGTVDAPWNPLGTSLVAVTSFGLIFQVIFLTSALLVALASISRRSDEKGAAIFFGLLLFATLGMTLAALAADLIYLLLAIEVTGISTYLLVGYTRRDARGLEAAMKFYIIGALSAALSFFGASLLYAYYGTTNLAILGTGFVSIFPSPLGGATGIAFLGYGFLIVGVGFKVTAVPFHAWAVDVYDGAPSDVSAFLAGGSKKVGLFAFFIVFLVPILASQTTFVCPGGPTPTCHYLHPSFGIPLQVLFGVLAVVTMTVGNVLALMQTEMKRMLAYSSISQAGYMLIGLAVASSPAIAGATLQIFAHIFMKAGAFLVVAAVAGFGIGSRIEDWKGVGLRHRWLGGSFAAMLLSLAGIPLTVGFVSKFVLFSAAVQAQGWFVWLAVAGLLNSALSVFYYARVLRVMYMERPEVRPGTVPAGSVMGGSGPPALAFGGIGFGRAAAIGLATAAIFAFGVYPQPVLAGLQTAADHLIQLL
ncbi:MAG: NADH-quinone oxidoreductase subunit N [Thermoplasmata archaeon]|nr:NADH-quinone oxidoreductase subunit N [Thermoplasmata archaeon]